jgi:hypothetical protein
MKHVQCNGGINVISVKDEKGVKVKKSIRIVQHHVMLLKL